MVEAPAANGKIASLLDRGYMALEDGDYDKADGFELIIGECSFSFLNNFQETNENIISVTSPVAAI